MKLESELKSLMNSKVIGIDNTIIYFDNGIQIYCHEYETYVDRFLKQEVDANKLKYYSKGYWGL